LGAQISPDTRTGATSINNRSEVAGSLTGSISGSKGFVYHYLTGRLETFSVPGSTDTGVSSINNHGQVVGDSAVSPTNTFLGVFLRQPNGQIIDLGLFGGMYAQANDINDRGEIVGSFLTSDGVEHAFLLQPGETTPQELGSNMIANAINDRGEVVGSLGDHAFLYSGGRLYELFGFTAYDINNRGQIIGTANSGAGHGVVYLHGQLYDLNDLLSPAAAGRTITGPHAINDRGQIVANTITSDGTAFLPPVLLTPTYGSRYTSEPDSGENGRDWFREAPQGVSDDD
jgi:probable HAF family extracellular repeat protein